MTFNKQDVLGPNLSKSVANPVTYHTWFSRLLKSNARCSSSTESMISS